MTEPCPLPNSRRGLTLAGAGILLTWVLTIVGAVWAASADRQQVLQAVDSNNGRLMDHEARLRTLEQRIGPMANDVTWIRQTLQREIDRNPRDP